MIQSFFLIKFHALQSKTVVLPTKSSKHIDIDASCWLSCFFTEGKRNGLHTTAYMNVEKNMS